MATSKAAPPAIAPSPAMAVGLEPAPSEGLEDTEPDAELELSEPLPLLEAEVAMVVLLVMVPIKSLVAVADRAE